MSCIPDKSFLERVKDRWYRVHGKPDFFKKIMIRLEAEQGEFLLQSEKKEYSIRFGIGKMFKEDFPYYHQLYVASGQWLEKDTLYVEVRILGEEPCLIRFQLVFGDNELTLHMINTGELCFMEFDGWYGGKMA